MTKYCDILKQLLIWIVAKKWSDGVKVKSDQIPWIIFNFSIMKDIQN